MSKFMKNVNLLLAVLISFMLVAVDGQDVKEFKSSPKYSLPALIQEKGLDYPPLE